MKRRVLTLLVFLAAGAIVNVAMAWGCVLWSQIDEQTSHRWHRFWHESYWSGYGVSLHESLSEGGDQMRVIRWAETHIIAGWPFHSLRGSVENHPFTVGMPFISEMGDRVMKSAVIVPVSGALRDVAPIRPILPGFAINTVFYAVILWLPLAAPFALRRRRRIKRGLCPKCAYPVGTSDVCTECGATMAVDRAMDGVRIRQTPMESIS